MYRKLFEPMQIGNCEIPNRLFVPAMVVNYSTYDGGVTERLIRYHEEKARGGWGLIITEDYAVQPNGKGYTRIPGLWKDEQIAGSRELTDRVHALGSKIFCQMYHPGRQATPLSTNGTQPVAPSGTSDPLLDCPAREMTVDEIRQLVADFGSAAGRAKEAGFDGIELHCAHGYLLAEFLSPYVNKRVDEYGGNFAGRVRIVDEIYAAMRAAVGEGFPLQVRLSGEEYTQGGRTEAETFELAVHLEELGFDSLNISNGSYASAAIDQIIAPMFTRHALNMHVSEQVKQVVDIPVLVANRINDPMMADALLRLGKADFIGMARGSLADPYLPAKAKAGKLDQIRYCIGCLQGCELSLFIDQPVTCLVNPNVGREYENLLSPAADPKSVMVIGGGPAGLYAAEVLAKRGHKPMVYEASAHLGGQFRSAAYPMYKGELTTFITSLRATLESLGVPIRMGTEVTEELIAAEKPDAIIIATGARPLVPPISGVSGENVVFAEDVLYGDVEVRQGPVVVCGGGEVGAETAQFIAERRSDVTIVEMRDDILLDMMPIAKSELVNMINRSGVKVITNATVCEIAPDHVTYSKEDGTTHDLPAATVISAFGYGAYNPLEEAARRLCDNVQVVGCAIKAGNALVAVCEGFEAAARI